MPAIDDLLRAADVVFTEGAVVERLRRELSAPLDPHVVHAHLVYDPAWRHRLGKFTYSTCKPSLRRAFRSSCSLPRTAPIRGACKPRDCKRET
ncbi:hypothetical protein GCM10010885_09810 [Alicyclobacillus cellulosilyticus]|uniref:Uncharacterized protein n=1 Tax=Alicyclobacillus cellulosilyticus TaxID=1003997 RepID=A0A917K783_9BACL|nr:hypothetical protein [Alicyclobacillus cellulosilyticus]GGJ02552.1 hypothetical protein GCM10010885_09810 [Alicyclobacillus cellulosilyticus]